MFIESYHYSPNQTNPLEADLHLLSITEAEGLSEEYYRAVLPLRLAKANRFRCREDRLRCLAAGLLLREVLHLNEEDICTGPYGKPYAKNSQYHFSLSHSGDYAVLAVSPSFETGVDIEVISNRNLEQVAERICTEEELRWLSSGMEDRFFQIWTMKESLSKSLGLGLMLDFRSFSVLPLLEQGQLTFQEHKFSGYCQMIHHSVISVCCMIQ